jgi:hypothetical protein
MTQHRTALLARMTERRKARARLPLLALLALICPPLVGVRSISVWIPYFVFVILYSLWSLRLTGYFSGDRRLGYLLCLTDAAILLPLLMWSAGVGLRIILALVWAAGLAFTYRADQVRAEADGRNLEGSHSRQRPASDRSEGVGTETPLERAVRVRLRVFTTTGARFGLVVLRIVRFEEMASYYGDDASNRVLSAVSRRGLRLLGPDAQRFPLPGGRVAFLFETDSGAARVDAQGESSFAWIDPYDIEGLAMTLGRKACEHLVDGHRVECVAGWASAPADGLNADDLMYAAESGAQSTAAFRRIAGSRVPVPERARAAAG